MLKYQIINNNKKEWVVFIHGIGGSTKTWRRQIETFSEQYNLLLLDLPGHGEDSNHIIKTVDENKLNKGIVDTLNFLNIKTAHFIGLSLGTLVAVNFAVKHPERVDKIILGGAAVKVCGIARLYVRAANLIKKIMPFKSLCKFFAWFLLPRQNHKTSRAIFVREAMKLNKTTISAWMSYLKNALHPEAAMEKLNNLGKKVLVIVGDEDHCFLRGAKKYAQQIKGSTLNIIERCGHVCSIEKDKVFNALSLKYLRT